ncbi:MAG: (2Fe-2S)-binding protein, partial [Deltaproteobacteria bacterium]|nr:(2Fe-2S)-binding protein [Deltaproteobacteria bacterium]
MISLTIDGKEVTIEKGKTILDAARKADVYIPTLCHDSRVTPYGACRMCVVEDKNRGKRLIPSCFTPVRDGMDIVTETPEIVAARRTQLQLMLVNHPLDCPVCDKAGECSLQELVLRYNITDTQYHLPEKRKDIDRVSPLIERNMNRCILCGLCVRICGELQGTHEIDFIGRGIETLIGTDGQRPLCCDFCGQCVSVCPVGALTDTLFKDVTRVWKLEKHETVCSHCGLGCSIDLNTEHNKIRRVTAPASDDGDISNLCVRGRFGWSAYEPSNRLSSPRVRIKNRQETVQWHEAISRAAENIDRIRAAYGGDAFAFISSDVWTTEEAYAYQIFCRSIIGSNNMGSTEAKGYRQIVTILNEHSGEEWKQGTLTDFEKAEVILVIGGGAVELHPVLKPMINTFLKKDGGELVVISSWRDYLLERATLPIEIKPECQEIFLSELRESLSGNIECRQSDVSEFGVDCSELVRLVSLLDGEKEILFLVAPCMFGDNEQLGQLAAYLNDRVRAILPLGAQCNSRGAMFQAGFSSILQPGGMPVEKSKRGLNHTDEIFKAIENGTIKALYLLGDDPLENSPDPERIK